MLVLIQRVSSAAVSVHNNVISKIGRGLLVFVGAVKGDTEKEIPKLVNKIVGLRIFEDEEGKMNLSVKDVAGEILVVPQFTLAANCKKGRRPSFDNAALPKEASGLCNKFSEAIKNEDVKVSEGQFAAHMDVCLVNDGPVTIWLDSQTL